MELTRRLLRWGYRRPHVLPVAVPGFDAVRRAAERELDARGWPLADGPASADVLLCCGPPGPQMQEPVDRVWAALPGPRTRRVAGGPADVAVALDDARRDLQDLAAQQQDAAARAAVQADLAMASTGDDRDGLQLDVLHLQLGPVLLHWPAGLVLHLEVHGDVVTAAEVEVLDGAARPEPLKPAPVRRLDHAAGVLALAGAHREARMARRLRYRAEDGVDVGRDVQQLRDAVAGNRVLRWSLRDLPAVGAADLWQRLLGLLGAASDEPVPAQAVSRAVVGAELTAVRLAVAAAPPLGEPERALAHA